MKYERALAMCSKVHCYLAVLEEYGSRATRDRAAQMSSQQISELSEISQRIAADHIDKTELYVVDAVFEGGSPMLKLGSKTYPGFAEKVYFVRENETWKTGAD